MKPPAEAGAIVVDLRRVGRLPIPRAVRWVLAVLGLLLVIGVLQNDPQDGWKLLALFGGAFGGALLLLRARRQLQVVCEHGLVVRNFVRTQLVPWSEVRGLRSRRRSMSGQGYTEYLIEAGGRPIMFTSGAGPIGDDYERVLDAYKAIERLAGVELRHG